MATILFNKDGEEIRVKNVKKVKSMIDSGDFFTEAPGEGESSAVDPLDELREKASAAGIKNVARKGAKRLTEELAALES